MWNSKEEQLRQEVVAYGKKLQETGLVQGSWGNLSVRLDDQYMLVTPSGLDYQDISPADVVKVDILTGKWEGDLKPTSEKRFHCRLYTDHPSAGAIVHTHATYCCIYAAANMPLEIEDPAKAELLGEFLPVARYALSGTKELTDNVVAALSGGAPGCIMNHHGMLCLGSDLGDALSIAQMMEEAAREAVERRWAEKYGG